MSSENHRGSVDAIIGIRDLEFRWQSASEPVLLIDELNIAAGEHLFIRGPSGSGKSSLLALLAGVAKVTSGSLSVLGRPLERLGSVDRDHLRANHIGYIFQQFNLIPYLSVVDNVLLPCRFSKTRRSKALERASSLVEEALRLLTHLDMGHEKLISRPVSQLSVGQQQRVAAARALMGAPELVIADEPTSALDHDRRAAFIRLLFAECREVGSTLVFVSHDASLESLFHRTLDLALINRARPHDLDSAPLERVVAAEEA